MARHLVGFSMGLFISKTGFVLAFFGVEWLLGAGMLIDIGFLARVASEKVSFFEVCC